LLVSAGVIGLTVFMVLCVYVLHRSVQTLKLVSVGRAAQDRGALVLVAGLVICLATLILMGILTGLEFYLGYFYFVISMLIASNLVFQSEAADA